MPVLRNRAGVKTATVGTGTVTLGAALANTDAVNAASWRTFANAGVNNADVVRYLILDSNGAWEYGTGTYTSAGTTLSRTLGASSTGALLVLSGNAQVFIAAIAEDMAVPGGASLTLQYNNAGVFAGMTGTSWDDVNKSLVLTGQAKITSRLYVNPQGADGLNVGGATARFILPHNGNLEWGAFFQAYGANGTGASNVFTKTRGATPDVFTIVNSGDQIALIDFEATDGTTYADAASIGVYVDGTPGVGSMPGRLVFSTTPSGSAGVTERLRIDNAGRITLAAGSQITGTGETRTASLPLLDLSQTWNSVATTGASGTGVTATLTFAAQPAALAVGSTITVAGVTPAGYNGTYTVTASTTTSVSYANTTTGAQTVAGTIAATFTGLKLNVTNTASTTASRLLDLQRGGTSVLNIGPSANTSGAGNAWDGDIIKWTNSSGTLTITQSSSWNDVIVTLAGGANNSFSIVGGSIQFTAPTVLLRASTIQAFGPFGLADPTGGSTFAYLQNEVNNGYVVALRNGTHAHTLLVYNTFTDASNYERGVFDWTTNANILTVGTFAAGTGTVRNAYFGTFTGTSFPQYGISCRPANSATDIWCGGNQMIALDNSGSGSVSVAKNLIIAGAFDLGLWRSAAGVLQLNNATINTLTGTYLNWGGQARVTSDVAFTSTAALATVTGLSVNVAAGRTYSFEAYLSFTDAAAGGIQAAIAGTATATAIEYDGWIIDSAANGIKGNAQATALGTAVASATTTGTAGVVQIKGTITVNAAGTLLVQAAQNTSNGTATTIKRGSYFIVHDMP